MEQDQSPIRKPLITMEQAAKILNVTYHRMADLVRQKIVPSVRLGRQVRIDPDELERFIRDGGRALPGGWRKED
jgi:putative molybdopterin biosynthesis protein